MRPVVASGNVSPAQHRRGQSGLAFAPRSFDAVNTALSLDAVNFLLADVRGALGPYLNVFLVTQQHWSSVERRSGDDSRRPARACRADTDRCCDRRDPLEARHHRGGSHRAGCERRHHLCGPALLAGDGCEHADRCGRRRVRPGDRRTHAWPLRAHGSRTPHGPQRGLRSRGQCRDCCRGRRCRMGVLAALGLSARADLCGACGRRRVVHSKCRHRPRARTRRRCRRQH